MAAEGETGRQPRKMLSFLSLTQTMTKTRVWGPAVWGHGILLEGGPSPGPGRPPIGRPGERVCEEKPRKGKEQGAAMGPTNFDVTADAAHPSVCLSICPFYLGWALSSGESRIGKNWQRAELSIPTGSASGRLGLWTGTTGTDFAGHWPLATSRRRDPCQRAQIFSCLIFPFSFPRLSLFPLRDHQFRPSPLATGHREIGKGKGWVAQPNYCICRRNVLCACDVCDLISFHYLHTVGRYWMHCIPRPRQLRSSPLTMLRVRHASEMNEPLEIARRL